ncbi:MAG: RNase adapter RapZ [Paludibacteraceae bacterium]|nr:phosphotransferase [Prevotellaceae bacterium]
MTELISLFEEYTGQKNPTCTKIKGEGSNRIYYRFTSSDKSLIGVLGESIEENEAFIALAKHFEEKNLPTPRVYAVSKDHRRYLQEDLGDTSLFQYISKGISEGKFSEEEESMICQTMGKLPEIQFSGAKGLDFSVCYPLPSFDKRSILWDLNYFKYSFLKLLKIDFSETKLEDDFERMCGLLLGDKSDTFLYRDFQSRNVMIKNGEPHFIDFQGGRKGPIYYDIASFAWQAKANFSDELREKLIRTYLNAVKRFADIDEDLFRKRLRHFVLFRTMQVLGAYGFRGIFEKKPHFIESIPFAVNNLKSLLAGGYPEYPYLTEVLANITELPDLQMPKTPNEQAPLKVQVFSFSYKKGIPVDESGNGGGYVFDCRGVHNPGRYIQYKTSTGLDKNVIDFLESDGEILHFLDNVYSLADAHVARFIERGFTHLMFSFGCTGGQHRSVYSAQHTAEHIAKKFGVEVEITHREQGVHQIINPHNGKE